VYIGVDPSTSVNDWIRVDVRTLNNHTNGNNVGYWFGIPDADSYPAFGKMKVRILAHYGTNANYSTIGRLQLFTLDLTSRGGNDFRLNE
jgi:hypothetical protein